MKFSVLLPTRNRLDLLSRAVETVRRQDYDNWEIIISDNASEEDVAGYVRSLDDSRIKYFRTDRFIPVTDNWNNALDNSDGDYVIMLGDDDGLLKEYFSTLKGFIDQFGSPDFVYTGALLYAYPGVLPGTPDGFLRTYGKRKIFQSATEPFWLDHDKAMQFVHDSLNFRVTFDYNMQFSLVSRQLILAMWKYGPFYQSPYPDYYASNVMMAKAQRILVLPQPLITIGISPKSFGFYYFNDAEAIGNEFLNNLPQKEMVSRLEDVILPGTAMNTSWLIAMETLAVNLAGELPLKVNYARYRFIQIIAVYAGLISGANVGKALPQLRQKIKLAEWLCYGLMLAIIAKIAPARLRPSLSFRMHRAAGSHPGTSMPQIPGKFQTITDVFEQVDARSPAVKT